MSLEGEIPDHRADGGQQHHKLTTDHTIIEPVGRLSMSISGGQFWV